MAAPQDTHTHTHTRRYLLALFHPNGQQQPPVAAQSPAVSSPRLASLNASRAAAAAAATTTTVTASSINATGEIGGGGGSIPTVTTPLANEIKDDSADSSTSRLPIVEADDDDDDDDDPSERNGRQQQNDAESKISTVMEVLTRSDIAEDEKPDKLKELLRQILPGHGADLTDSDLDSIVLAILHRHREDVSPTGQTFSTPSSTAARSGGGTGTLSRSSSFRRTFTPTSASSLAVKRATGMSTPTRPISPSPLRSQSPSVQGGPRKDSLEPSDQHQQLQGGHQGNGNGNQLYLHQYHHNSSASSNAASSAPSSPFGSPRVLNASAVAFKPNAAAAEFKPAGAQQALPATAAPATPSLRVPSNLSVKMPDLTLKHSRSPMGTPHTESSPTVWSFQNSPLGTPKYATGGVTASPSLPSASGSSYFPIATTNALLGRSSPAPPTPTNAPPIPSDPWSNPGISHSASTASSESSHDDNHSSSNDPFASGQAGPANVSGGSEASGKAQILSSEEEEEEEEWGIPATSYEEAAKRVMGGDDVGLSSWNPYEDEDEDDDGLEILQFKGGQLLPDAGDELILVDPPNQERPVFEEGYFPQSTSQYSQLPQNLSGSTSQAPLTPTPGGTGSGGMNNFGGLGESSSSNYIMTPFDVLCSIFAGSDISPADLEEALSLNGWDVDRSMEWIINNPRLSAAGHPIDPNVERLTAMSLDATPPARFGGAPSPGLRPPGGPAMSGNRPHVISRDSFQKVFSPHGRPASPRWGAFGDGRPTTPGGRSDRSGDGYFSGSAGAPSTRLCKYYLQGNCLRSDCRFSHDLSKAVCKFWLRGHCLKGEGRCEFLHSVPPHLANDVAALRANAMRARDHEKGRFGRSQFDEDGNRIEGGGPRGRVEEDFPSLAAATAQRNSNKEGSASRWAGIVKNGRPNAFQNRPPVPRSASGNVAEARFVPYSQPRPSGRIPLRPPTLLPTVSTGAAVAKMYEQYREDFFDYGNARNKCLVKAAACWKARDGAGAKHWSREAQEWNRRIAQEGAAAAGQIIAARKKELLAAVMSNDGRPGRADEMADRQYRGKDCGAGLGICLGVAAAGEILGPEGSRLSASERTEAALDLHGLHPDEAIEFLEKFLLAVASENVVRGLVYIIVGQERHTGTADPARGTRKVRLADAVGSWLDGYSYAFWLTNGIYAIDPYL